jgi:protocatechuate 3,4-dioxygenase beta subunit
MPRLLSMDRRTFLLALTVAATTPAVRSLAFTAQDVEFLRALERAQLDRPRVLTANARIAPATEPGIPLVIHGRVFRHDGRTPAPDVIVFAYHTDATGRYDVPSAGPHSWRLRGWARTDADGRFEFATIRPAPYPNRNVAAHVHISLDGPGIPRQDAGLLFEGDPFLTAAEQQDSAKAGVFGSVRPVEVRDGVQHVTLNIQLAR